MSTLSDIFTTLSGGGYSQFPTDAIPAAAFQGTPTVGSPLAQNLPKNVTAYEKLQGQLQSALQANPDLISPDVVSAFQRLQAQRLARGQAPSSGPESAELLAAGQNLTPTNPVPDKPHGLGDILGNAVGDVRDIFTAIPKLPFMLYHTARDLPTAPAKLSEALASHDPSKLSQVPGLNLVPGVYSIGNILSGNWGEIAQHPLMNALDLLPYAKAEILPAELRDRLPYSRTPDPHLARRFTPTEALVADQVAADALAAGRPVRYTGPALQEKVAEFEASQRANPSASASYTPSKVSLGELLTDYTPVGRYLDRAKLRFRQSRVGQAVTEKVSESARNVSSLGSLAKNTVADMYNPESPMWRDLADPSSYPARAKRAQAALASKVPGAAQPGDAALIAMPEVFELRQKYLDPEEALATGDYKNAGAWAKRREELTNRIQHESVPDILADPHVTGFERQWLSDTMPVVDKIVAPYLTDNAFSTDPLHQFGTRTVGGQEEIYPIGQAQRHAKFTHRVTAATEASRILSDPEAISHPSTISFLNDQNAEWAGSRNVRGARGEILDYALARLSAGGADMSRVVNGLRAAGLEAPEMIARARQWVGQEPPALTVDDVIASYKQRRPGRVSVPEGLRGFHEALTHDNFRRAYQIYTNDILDKKSILSQLPAEFLAIPRDELKSLLYRSQDVTDFAGPVETRAATLKPAAKALSSMEQNLASARFYPRIAQETQARTVEFAQALTRAMDVDPAAADVLTEQVRSGIYGDLDRWIGRARAQGLTKQELGDVFPRAREGTLIPESVKDLTNTFGAEARGTWLQWREAGFDPQFVPKYDTSGPLTTPRILPRSFTPSQTKARTLDFAPESSDLAIAVEKQAQEWLVKSATDDMVEMFVHGSPEAGITAATTTREQLEPYLRDFARDRAIRHGTTQAEELDRMIQSQFQEFNPESLLNFPRPSFAHNTQNLLIDKSMLSVLEQMVKPPKVNALWDPVMKVFRTSVLTLSPRWQMYNLLGNSLMMAMQHGVSPLKYLGEARQVLKYLADPEVADVPAAMQHLSESMRLSLSQQPRQFAELSHRETAAWARKLGSEQRMEGLGGVLAKGSKGFDTATDFLTKLNGRVDDAYRLMVYFDGLEKGNTALGPMRRALLEGGEGTGSTSLPNRLAAEKAVRSFMYSWDAMTPFERNTMRMVFPFYGFMSHMMRFAYQYTVDHPVRLAVTAGFARNEMSDWKEGLPERLRGMYIQDYKPGVHKAINMAGWNPFADVASMFSLAGLLSQANPVIATVAEQFGIDPRTGQANLYPDSAYDPQTGRLKLKTRSVGVSLLENLIPQAQVLTSKLGINQDLAGLSQTDPEAARRMTLSAFGVPTLVRDVDLSLEAMKAEGARRNAYRQGLSQAMSAPARPSAYPVLRQLQTQILQLQKNAPGPVSQYTPAGLADIQQGVVTALGG